MVDYSRKMSNRNKSVAPYNPKPSKHQQDPYSLVPADFHRGAFDDFDRMADRMMSNFGMPKMSNYFHIFISFDSDGWLRRGSIRQRSFLRGQWIRKDGPDDERHATGDETGDGYEVRL